MNTIIRQCIDNIQDISSLMKEMIDNATTSVSNISEPHTVERSKINFYKLLIIFSLLIIMVGLGFGCFVDSFLWLIPCLLGVIGLVVGWFLQSRSNRIQSSHGNHIITPNLATLKQSKTQSILSVASDINNLWENQSRENRDRMLLYLDNIDLSSNDKFNASSLIVVTKTIDFELLKIHNQIDNATSIVELNECLINIKAYMNDKLDSRFNQQVEAYQQFEKILCKLSN